MSDQLRKQLEKMEGFHREAKKAFLADGTINTVENALLSVVETKLQTLRVKVAEYETKNGGGVCEPVRPSEAIAGAASSQYSYGDVTDESAAEGQSIHSGVRENAENDDNDLAGEGVYTNGSNPMQSPDMGGNFTKRYGIGFLCDQYAGSIFGPLAEVQGYMSPTSKYQQAFKGMDKTKQFNDPTTAQILAGIVKWVDLLAKEVAGCGAGELVVSYQGHGMDNKIYGVDERPIARGDLMKIARKAESKRVSITYILDACETGGMVGAFQDHAADAIDRHVDETEGAGQMCSEENEATAEQLRDMMAHARELIMMGDAIAEHGDGMVSATMTVQAGGGAVAIANAWKSVLALNKTVLAEAKVMQGQFLHNMDFGSDPEMKLDVIEGAFSTLITALGKVKASTTFDLDNDWCAKVGAFQDTISDGANRIIKLCKKRAKEYQASF